VVVCKGNVVEACARVRVRADGEVALLGQAHLAERGPVAEAARGEGLAKRVPRGLVVEEEQRARLGSLEQPALVSNHVRKSKSEVEAEVRSDAIVHHDVKWTSKCDYGSLTQG
jgi:hypothetical protein